MDEEEVEETIIESTESDEEMVIEDIEVEDEFEDMEYRIQPKSRKEKKLKNEDGIVCHRCKKPAVGRYSPNEDDLGLAFCKEHKTLMGLAFYCLMTDNLKDFNELMGTDL